MNELRKYTKIVGIYCHGRDSNRACRECRSENVLHEPTYSVEFVFNNLYVIKLLSNTQMKLK